MSLGDHDWTQGAEADSFKRAVSRVKMHPSYGQGAQFNNDVCLLKLEEPVSFLAHSHVRPICLPETSGNTYANQMAAVAGWGRTGNGNSISTVLLETDLRVWPKEGFQCRLLKTFLIIFAVCQRLSIQLIDIDMFNIVTSVHAIDTGSSV